MNGQYRHFHEVYTDLGAPKNVFLAQAYRYSHSYTSDDMEPEQNILEKNNGVLLIRELPDTGKIKRNRSRSLFCYSGYCHKTSKRASYVRCILWTGFSC